MRQFSSVTLKLMVDRVKYFVIPALCIIGMLFQHKILDPNLNYSVLKEGT